MKYFSLLTLLGFCLLFAAHMAAAKNLACQNIGPSCLKQQNLELSVFPAPVSQNFSTHGISMILINDKVALLKLSFPRLQYRDLCRQLGIHFAGKSLHL